MPMYRLGAIREASGQRGAAGEAEEAGEEGLPADWG